MEEKKIKAYKIDNWDLPIVPAPLKRDWMSNSINNHPYRCLPLDIANQYGWFILCKHDFEVIWDGKIKGNGLKIIFSENEELKPGYIQSHFGYGILTFNIPYLFRTPKGYNLHVRGPANHIKPGIQPLEGIIETDWASMSFTMNWKVTIPNFSISFKKGEPFCMITPYKREDIESFSPTFESIEANPVLKKEHELFVQKRKFNYGVNQIIKDKDKLKKEYKQFYDKDYMEGHLVNKKEKFKDHQNKLKIKPFQDMIDRDLT